MFFAIILIAIGVALLLSGLGLVGGSFWGIFWGVIFLVIGIRAIRKNNYPMCEWGEWQGKMKQKIHDKCCDCDCSHEEVKKESTKKQK